MKSLSTEDTGRAACLLTRGILLLPTALSCWLILSFPCFSAAQPHPFGFERFSVENGLPNNIIDDIAQDHRGYIWLATDDGLVKYDGYRFFTYQNRPDDSTSLSQNPLEKLYVDFTGDLWIGSTSGLDRYSPACDCFFRYAAHASAPANQQAGLINAFAEDRDGNLWIGTQQGGLFRYERDSDRFTRFLDDPNDPNNVLADEVRVLLVDRTNQLWIGTGETFDATATGGGLIRLDLKTGRTRRFLHDPANPHSLLDNRVSALMEDQRGTLWVGSCQSGLHYYDPEQEAFIRMMPDPAKPDQLIAPQGEMGWGSSCPHVTFIHETPDGEFWIGTFNAGVNHFDPVSGTLTHYQHEPADPGSLRSNLVWSFLQDRQGRTWIGNLQDGLHKSDPSRHKFRVYRHDPQDPASLSHGTVLGVYQAPGHPEILWMGTRGGGLNRLDTRSGRFQHYRHDPADPYSISSDIAWTAYEDRSGTFWVGTEAGLDTLDRQTGRFTPYRVWENNAYGSIPDPVIRIHEDRQGNLWLGTWSGGVLRLSRDKKTVERYTLDTRRPLSYYNSAFALREDSQGTLWVGVFRGGLYQYDARQDRFIHHLREYGATCFQEDSTGLFWVGTASSGLLHYNTVDSTFRQYTTDDGLPSNGIFGMATDKSGRLWLSTGKGIARFEPDAKRFTSYGVSDGLSFTSFSQTSGFTGSDGQVFFGGRGGLVAFYPEQVRGNPYPPEVLISGLEVAGNAYSLLDDDQDDSAPIALSHRQNDLTFEYVGLHFTDPAKNSYKYRLLPYDSDWIDAGTQRTARYTNLDPGEYTFQAIASSSDGVWSEAGASLHLYIIPPWWTRWWAYALFVGLLVGIGNWFYRFKLSRKLAVAESNRLKEMDQLKSSLYTNVTHEFRTPLTVILGMADHLQAKAEDQQWQDAARPLEMIQRNGNNLLRLVNEMLDLARLESGHLQLELVQSDVIPYLKYLSESFHSLAQEKHIDLTVYSEIEELIMDFDVAKLAVIMSNLLANALKFTPERGKVIIHLNEGSAAGRRHFFIKVKDNGDGIAEAAIPRIFDRFYQGDHSATRLHEGTGIGLALTKELVELMGGTIAVRSAPGKGSEFLVKLPVTTDAPTIPAAREYLDIIPPAVPVLETIVGGEDDDQQLPLVLIIEDNWDVANYLKIALGPTYQCLHAANGGQGLDIAFAEIPDLIICDVMMPGMDGFEVCSILKTDERSNHIPIIMLTARVGVEDRLTGLSQGADAYLAKPFEKEELLIRLDNLIGVRKRLQQKYSSQLVSSSAPANPVEQFLVTAEEIILEHLEEEEFSVDDLARAIHLSRSQLHRKIKALTGQSTSIYIRLIRLQQAKVLLATGQLSISEVAYQVGFKSPAYFSQMFKKTFGESPSASSH